MSKKADLEKLEKMLRESVNEAIRRTLLEFESESKTAIPEKGAQKYVTKEAALTAMFLSPSPTSTEDIQSSLKQILGLNVAKDAIRKTVGSLAVNGVVSTSGGSIRIEKVKTGLSYALGSRELRQKFIQSIRENRNQLRRVVEGLVLEYVALFSGTVNIRRDFLDDTRKIFGPDFSDLIEEELPIVLSNMETSGKIELLKGDNAILIGDRPVASVTVKR